MNTGEGNSEVGVNNTRAWMYICTRCSNVIPKMTYRRARTNAYAYACMHKQHACIIYTTQATGTPKKNVSYIHTHAYIHTHIPNADNWNSQENVLAKSFPWMGRALQAIRRSVNTRTKAIYVRCMYVHMYEFSRKHTGRAVPLNIPIASSHVKVSCHTSTHSHTHEKHSSTCQDLFSTSIHIHSRTYMHGENFRPYEGLYVFLFRYVGMICSWLCMAVLGMYVRACVPPIRYTCVHTLVR